MAVSLQISLQGNMLKGLNALLAAGENLEPAMDEIGAMLVSSIQNRFETGKGPDGKAWTPSRRALDGGGQTLVKDGHLRDSISHKANGNSVEVGTNRIYAAIHQFGGTIKPKNGKRLAFRVGGQMIFALSVTLPARPYLGFSNDDQGGILEILTDHIRSAVQ